MHAHVDEGLLVEVGLVDVTNQLLGGCFDAEASDGLNQLGALGEIALLLELAEVRFELALVLGVRDLLHVLVHDVLELLHLHGLGERLQLLLGDVHLLPLEQGVIHLLLRGVRLRLLGRLVLLDGDAVKVL
jgi:hypothetical protein